MSGTTKGLQLRSLIKKSGELELSLAEVPIPEPGPDQVLVKVEATPINPSDLGLLLGPADMSTAKASGSGAAIKITAKVPEQALPFIAARLDQAMPVGNEGAGTVIKASSSEAAQALLGKTVSMIGGAMYAQYRLLKATDCQPLPAGTTAAEGASWFVNPLTALGMTETMKREGHKALVHTAAASNLGQMLNKICQEDGIGLVNIVRSAEQAKLLYGIGAKHVVEFDLGHLYRGADAGAGRDRRHYRLRRDRRRQARQPDPDLHGGGAEQDRQGIQPLRLNHAQAGLHLRQPQHRAGRADAQLRHGLGRGRLAADAVPAEDRPVRAGAPTRARGEEPEDHLHQPLHENGVAHRGARPREHRRLRQARYGREVPDQSQQGLTG